MGGWETLSAAVESLYNRMRNDARCTSLFTEADEQQLKTHMVRSFPQATGRGRRHRHRPLWPAGLANAVG